MERFPARSPIGCAGVVAVLIGALTGAGCGGESSGRPQGQMPPVAVQIVTADPGRLASILSAVGTLESRESTTVAAEVGGLVMSLDIPEGRGVGAGHLLARLDDAEASATLSVAQARFKNAERRLERLRSLREASVSSQQALDDALAEFDSARGQLEEADTRLRKTYVHAPFSGLLGLREANLGQYLSPGDPIVQITEIDPLELVFSLPERDSPRIRLGQEVLGVVGRCGQRFRGEVNAIDPRVDPATRMLRIQARVPNAEAALYPGMSARVRLVVDEIPNAIVIPRAAIIRQGTRYLLYSIDEGGLARQHRVELGEFFVDGVHVRSGIDPGARVVVAGHQKLRPGSPTESQPYAPVRNPNLELGWFGPESDCGS